MSIFVKAILISENRLISLIPLKNGNYWCNRDAKEYEPIELNFNYNEQNDNGGVYEPKEAQRPYKERKLLTKLEFPNREVPTDISC
jgi:hypothetical protein